MNVSNQAVYGVGEIIALLGPTNTGKTYRALQSMAAHDSGMIGFPLRLLARENYDKLVKIKGAHKVALVTGEEKIIPRQARYYCCTVESMPVDQGFEFVAVDEIQLAQDPERGHIFTDRLLRARGGKTTMFMGSDTMGPLLSGLIPGIRFENCTRFSELSYTGYKKLTRLPKRSAIVAFSMDDVYNMAEFIRRQRGGTAVVLGALSPRTRNAQVDMYQSGEVDFLVATDAIGMGLNMDIHHVALAGTRKFDGAKVRNLSAAELAQIAGRAGRYMRDGTFGITDRVSDLEPETIEAIENHRFPSVKDICWRNSNLNFDTPRELLRSLELPSGNKTLIKGRPSDDYLTLKALMMREDLKPMMRSGAQTRLLWDVCQIPDFRQTLSDTHQDLMADIFKRLSRGQLDEDWVASQMNRLDQDQGDVDTLMARISHIRTWTYISFKTQWMNRAEYWQGRARAIEDKLSDALHNALINRFVDRRASVLMKSMEEGKELLAGVRANGDVIVETHLIGHLDGFRFIPDRDAAGLDYKAVMNTARQALRMEINRRKTMLIKSQPDQFQLTPDGQILWQQKQGSPLPGLPIAKITKGEDLLHPALVVESSDLLADQDMEEIKTFLQKWLEGHIQTVLAPLMKLQDHEDKSGAVRGICYHLIECSGIVPRETLESLIADLTPEDRAALRAYRIKLGPVLVFLPELNKPAAIRLRALLWGLYHEQSVKDDIPADGVVSRVVDPKTANRAFYQSIGYPIYGPRAVRIDMLDRVISAVYDAADKGKFQAKHEMAEWLGSPIEDLYKILEAMGHKKIYDPAEQAEKAKDDVQAELQEELQKADVPAGADTGDAPSSGESDNAELKGDAPLAAEEKEQGQQDQGHDQQGQVQQEQGQQEQEQGDPAEQQQPAGSESDEKQKDQAEEKLPEKPAVPPKPELATFRLKKGKAFEKARPSQSRPPSHHKKGQEKGANGGKPQHNKKDAGGGKRARRGNPKGKDYKQSNMSAAAKTDPSDNPFAVLEQLKNKS